MILFIMSLSISCKRQEAACSWTSDVMIIDGKRSDWVDKPFNYFENEDIVLGLSNDNDNLYLFFSFKNRQWAQMIRSGGLTLWFDGQGKMKKNWGLRFRGGPEMPGIPGESHPDRMST